MSQHFGPSAADLGYLARTAAMPWDEFWIAGGRITPDAEREPGLFEISQLLIGRQARLWVTADGIDTGSQDEVFLIAVGEDSKFGEQAHERRWRPQRARLEEFPASLPLNLMASAPREYGLVAIRRDATVRGAYESVEVDAGLLVTSADGHRLLFFADQDIPLDMYVTMDPLHIDGYLDRAVNVRRVIHREA